MYPAYYQEVAPPNSTARPDPMAPIAPIPNIPYNGPVYTEGGMGILRRMSALWIRQKPQYLDN